MMDQAAHGLSVWVECASPGSWSLGRWLNKIEAEPGERYLVTESLADALVTTKKAKRVKDGGKKGHVPTPAPV